ncbi:MAG: S-layer homology domain-containing protein [Candidatus Sericytochromatia bacterium]|nr:S-layer homology domain-containing protein [Candidatus Sericytochromatia bacterium]
MRLMKAASFAVATTITVSGVLMAAAPAFAYTPISEMQDVKRNHWAFNAIQALVEKYQIMEGYPDKTFRGQRPITRYEFAAALAKVMSKVEEMQSGQAPKGTTKPEVGADDLKTIAALQTEFRKELAELKGRTDNLEERVSKLERAKISGSVTMMYRDRVGVDPGVATASGDTNNGSSPFGDAFSINDAMPLRVKSHLGIHGSITPWATYHGNLHIDEMGFGQAAGRSTVASGHRGYEGLLGSPVFIEDSFVALGSWSDAHHPSATKDGDGNLLFAAGLMNFGHFIHSGTRIKNQFGNVGWMGRGYGMLGFGGNNVSGGANVGALPRFWGNGFDVSAVDPDSADYNKLSSPAVALGAGWGPVSLAFGTNAGSFYADRAASLQDLGSAGRPAAILTGASVGTTVRGDAVIGTQNTTLAAGQFGTTDLLNLPSQYNDGYSVASLDLDFGKPVGNDVFPVRANVSLGQFNNDGLFSFGANRSNLSFALDLGSDAFGIALQGNKGFLQPDKASLGIFANDIAGSGFGVGLGTNMAGRDILLGNFAGLLDANTGLYVTLPTFDGFLPQIVVGARQGLANGVIPGAPAANTALPMGNSGLTVSASYPNLGGSGFGVRAEYSSLMRSELWKFEAATHDLSIFTTYKF